MIDLDLRTWPIQY